MEEEQDSGGKILPSPAAMKESAFQRVVVTEIQHDACLLSTNTAASNTISEADDQKECIADCSIKQEDVLQGKEQIHIESQPESQENVVIISSNEPLEHLQRDVSGFQESQAESLMPGIAETSMHSTANDVIDREKVVGQNEEDREHQLLDDTSSNQLPVGQKEMFDTMTTLSATSEATQQQATYLTSQSINQIQTLSGHGMLNGSDVAFDSTPQGTHYIITGPQMQNINTIQAITQQSNGQVVLIQVPTSQIGNQVVVSQVSSGNIQSSLGSAATVPILPNALEAPEVNQTKRPRTKGSNRGKVKQLKQENSPTSLRPLAPRMLAVPISSPLVIAASTGAPQVNVIRTKYSSNKRDRVNAMKVFNKLYTTVTPMEQLQHLTAMPPAQIGRTGGQHFEVLGRCIVCFRFCRTTTYCRAEKNHTDVRAAACAECETKGFSTVVCRRKKQHKGPNAYPPNIVINTASSLSRAADLKDMCVKNLLPPCFSDLHSLTVHHADCIFAQPRIVKNDPEDQLLNIDNSFTGETLPYRKPTDYARGYLYPYSKESWEQWLAKFCTQTGTSYRIRTGKRVNKKSDHGLANHNGKIVVYRALESQLHNCALGGKPRKKAIREGSKRRKARGSKLIGCPAVIHTRVIVTEEGWKALEVTVPKLAAHLPVHDPRISSNDINNEMNNMIIPESLYDSEQGVTSQSQSEYAIIEDVGFHNEAQTELISEQIQLIDSLDSSDFKKQTKGLLEVCGGLLDDVSNLETLKTVHMHAQSIYNELISSNNQKRNRKRNASEAGLVHDDEVLEEGESRPPPVVLLQTEQV